MLSGDESASSLEHARDLLARTPRAAGAAR